MRAGLLHEKAAQRRNANAFAGDLSFILNFGEGRAALSRGGEGHAPRSFRRSSTSSCVLTYVNGRRGHAHAA